MCAPGWEMVGTRCRFLSFGIEVVWRDAIYCRQGTQPNVAHTRCVAIPLSLPDIPNFRAPSRGVVNTLFPAATGGRPPYSYSVTGLPAGISFSSSTRVARGTLPTVLVDTTYRITYSVRDSRSATASVTFTTVVTPPRTSPPPPAPSPPAPPPPGPSPSPPPAPPPPAPPPPTPSPPPPAAGTAAAFSLVRNARRGDGDRQSRPDVHVQIDVQFASERVADRDGPGHRLPRQQLSLHESRRHARRLVERYA